MTSVITALGARDNPQATAILLLLSEAPSVVHQIHDTSCSLIRSSNLLSWRTRRLQNSQTIATRCYPVPENPAASSYPCPAVSFWYYCAIYAFPSGLFLSDLWTKIFIHVLYVFCQLTVHDLFNPLCVRLSNLLHNTTKLCRLIINKCVHTAFTAVYLTNS